MCFYPWKCWMGSLSDIIHRKLTRRLVMHPLMLLHHLGHYFFVCLELLILESIWFMKDDWGEERISSIGFSKLCTYIKNTNALFCVRNQKLSSRWNLPRKISGPDWLLRHWTIHLQITSLKIYSFPRLYTVIELINCFICFACYFFCKEYDFLET